jgi:hypothetical protein
MMSEIALNRPVHHLTGRPPPLKYLTLPSLHLVQIFRPHIFVVFLNGSCKYKLVLQVKCLL